MHSADITPTDPPQAPAQVGQLGQAAQLARRRAFIEDVAWMASTAETAPGAAARLRLHPHSLREALDRAGRGDLWARLLANGDPTWRGYAGPTATLPARSRRDAA